MRLYDTEEVQEAVQEADKQYREEHRESLEAEKLAKQKEAAKQKADAAFQACTQFFKKSSGCPDFAQGSQQTTKLPLDVWGNILKKLCPASLELLKAHPQLRAISSMLSSYVTRAVQPVVLHGQPWLH